MVRNRLAILALLTGLNFLNYLDRFVVAAVLPRIETALSLSHAQAGSLATIFLLGYFVTSPIFGQLGDRGGRKGLIAMGVGIWSLATVASGWVESLGGLIVARAFVGVGEASYATLAPTIIDVIAPPDRRSRWLAIFYAATPIGSALGYLVGGFVEKHWGWRAAFYVAGGPGLLLALSCLAMEEPARVAKAVTDSLMASTKRLLGRAPYVAGVLGYAAFTFALGGFSYWAPTFLEKRYGMDLAKANFVFGAVTVVSGAIGTVLGGALGDRATRKHLAKASRPASEDAGDAASVAGNLSVCAGAAFVAAPLAVAAFLAPTPTIFFVLVFFCEVALFVTSSPINAVVLRSVPPALRASAMALCIFGIHLLGDLWSPPLVGFLADQIRIDVAMQILSVAIAGCAVIWYRGTAASASAAGATSLAP
jgi:MFS family permease